MHDFEVIPYDNTFYMLFTHDYCMSTHSGFGFKYIDTFEVYSPSSFSTDDDIDDIIVKVHYNQQSRSLITMAEGTGCLKSWHLSTNEELELKYTTSLRSISEFSFMVHEKENLLLVISSQSMFLQT